MEGPLSALECEKLIDRLRRAAIDWQTFRRCRGCGCGVEQVDCWTGRTSTDAVR